MNVSLVMKSMWANGMCSISTIGGCRELIGIIFLEAIALIDLSIFTLLTYKHWLRPVGAPMVIYNSFEKGFGYNRCLYFVCKGMNLLN